MPDLRARVPEPLPAVDIACGYATEIEYVMPLSRRVTLDVAHRFLATFGITSPTPTYNRWLKPDGFDPTDLWHVLAEDSPFILIFDWRSSLDELSYLRSAVQQLDVPLEFAADEKGCTARVWSHDQSIDVKYVPNNDDDFAEIIMAIQSILPYGIEFREASHNDGSDGWAFSVLPADEWSDLEKLDRDFVLEYFRPLAHRAGA